MHKGEMFFNLLLIDDFYYFKSIKWDGFQVQTWSGIVDTPAISFTEKFWQIYSLNFIRSVHKKNIALIPSLLISVIIPRATIHFIFAKILIRRKRGFI